MSSGDVFGGGRSRGGPERLTNDEKWGPSEYEGDNRGSGFQRDRPTSAVIGSSLSGDHLRHELIRVNEQLQRDLKRKEEKIIELQQQSTLKADYQKLAEEYTRLKFLLDQYRNRSDLESDFRAELEERDLRIEKLRGELDSQAQEYEHALLTLKREKGELLDDVELLEEKLSEHDAQNAALESQISKYRDEVNGVRKKNRNLQDLLDQLKDGTRVDDLDQEVMALRRKLQQAEADNDELVLQLREETEKTAANMNDKEDYARDLVEAHKEELKRAYDALEVKINEADQTKEELKAMNRKYTELEVAKSRVDERLMEARAMMTEYERGYDLTDAVGELKTVKAHLRREKENSEKLTQDLNNRVRQLQKWVAENRTLRERFNVADEWHLDEHELELHYSIESQKSQALIRKQDEIIERLEKERLDLMSELRKGAMHTAAAGLVFLDCNEEQTRKVAEYAERLSKGDETLPVDDKSKQLQAEVRNLEQALEEAKTNYYHQQIETDELRAKYLKTVEESKGEQYKSIMNALNNLQVQSTMQTMNPMSAVAPLTARGAQQFVFPDLEKQKSEAVASQKEGDNGLSITIPQQQPQQMMQMNNPGILGALSLLASLPPQEQQKLLGLVNPGGAASGASSLQLPQQSMAFDPKHLVPASDVVQQVDPYARSESRGDSSIPTPQPAMRQGGVHGVAPQDIPRSVAQMQEYERQVGFLGVFEELLQHEQLVKTANNEIDLYKLRFQKMCAQQQVLYEEYMAAQKKWAQEKMQLSRTVSDLMDQKDRADQQIVLSTQQIKHLKRESGLGDNEDGDVVTPDKYRIQDLERENLTLRVDMKVLARKFNSVDTERKEVSANNEKLMTEFLQMESVLRTRVTELIELKERAEGQTASMEELTKTWVPREELLKLSYEHVTLRDKYAGLITEKAETQIKAAEYREATARLSQLEEEMKTLREEHRAALDQSEKMQRTLDTVARVAQSADDEDNLSDYQRMKKLTQKLMGQLSGLQAKYESATLRAKRAQELKVLAETNTVKLQQDIEAIETKLGEANNKYQAEHEALMEMQQKLTGSVSYSKAIVLHKQLDDLRQENSDLRAEVKKYRSHAELAVMQTKEALESLSNPESLIARERREGYEKAILDLEQNSDEQAIIGKLHRQLIHANSNKRVLENKVASLSQEVNNLQGLTLKLEAHVDERNSDIFRVKKHYRSTLSDRDRQIINLQGRVSQTLTLRQAEALSIANSSLTVRLDEARQDAMKATAELNKLQAEVDGMKTAMATQDELVHVLTNQTSTEGGFDSAAIDQRERELRLKQQLGSWNKQVKQLRLTEMKLVHKIRELENKVKYLETSKSEGEEVLGRMQADLVEKEEALQKQEHEFKEQGAIINKLETQMQLKKSMRRIGKDHDKAMRKQKKTVLDRVAPDDDDAVPTKDGSTAPSSNKYNDEDMDDSFDSDVSGLSEFDRLDFGEFDSDDDDDQGRPGGKNLARGLDRKRRRRTNADVVNMTKATSSAWGMRMDKVVEDLKTELRHSRAMVDTQKAEIIALENKIAEIKANHAESEMQAENAEEVSQSEKQRILNTAQKTIEGLHHQLAQKNAAIKKYQEMLTSTRKQLQLQKQHDDETIEQLQADLLSKESQNMNKIQSALNFLDEMPTMPGGLVPREEMESRMKEKDNDLAVLNAELEVLQNKLDHRESSRKDNLTGEMNDVIVKLKEEKEMLLKDLAKEEEKVSKQAEEEKKLAELVHQFMDKMNAKDEKLKRLQEAIKDMKRGSLGNAAVDGAKGFDALEHEHMEKELKWDQERSKLNKRIVSLKNHVQTLKLQQASGSDSKNKSSNMLSDAETTMRSLESQLDKTRAQLSRTQKDKSRAEKKAEQQYNKLEAENVELQERVDKLKRDIERSEEQNDTADKRSKELKKQKEVVSKLKDRVKELEKEKTRLRAKRRGSVSELDSEGESDVDGSVDRPESKNKQAVERWKGEKKQQRRINLLRTKLQECRTQISELTDKNEKSDKRLAKAEKDKADLVQKIYQLKSSKGNNKDKDGGYGSDDSMASMDDGKLDISRATSREQIAQQLFEVQEEMAVLKKQNEIELPGEIEKLKAKNTRLLERCDRLLSQAEQESEGDPTARWGEVKWYQEKLDKVEGELLDSNMKLHELKYDSVQHGIQLQKLRTRIFELTKYNRMIAAVYDAANNSTHGDDAMSILKSSNVIARTPTKQDGKSSSSSSSSPSSSFVGGAILLSSLKKKSGQNVDSVIETLIRIINKLKAENSHLEKNSHSTSKYMRLVESNKKLKKQVEELRTAQDVLVKKMSSEPVLKAKEIDVVEKSMRVAQRALKRERELTSKLQKQVEELTEQKKLDDAYIAELKTKTDSHDTLSHRDWARERKNFQGVINELEAINLQQSESMQKNIDKLKSLTQRNKELTETVERLNYELRSSGSGSNTPTTHRVHPSKNADGDAANEEITRLIRDRSRLRKEVERLTQANNEYKEELKALDGDFWKEIMDLKQRYAKSVQLLQQSQNTNKQLQKQITEKTQELERLRQDT